MVESIMALVSQFALAAIAAPGKRRMSSACMNYSGAEEFFDRMPISHAKDVFIATR